MIKYKRNHRGHREKKIRGKGENGELEKKDKKFRILPFSLFSISPKNFVSLSQTRMSGEIFF